MGARTRGQARAQAVGQSLRRRHPVQSRILLQHRRLEVTQLRAGLQPEFVGEHLANLPQHVEGIGLPA